MSDASTCACCANGASRLAEKNGARYAAFGWKDAMLTCKRICGSKWSGHQEEGLHLWVAGARFAWLLSAWQAAGYLRQHRGIENGVCYVRAVTMDEDRLSERKIGYSLSVFRNVALNLLSRLDVRCLPDARRRIATIRDFGVHLSSD